MQMVGIVFDDPYTGFIAPNWFGIGSLAVFIVTVILAEMILQLMHQNKFQQIPDETKKKQQQKSSD